MPEPSKASYDHRRIEYSVLKKWREDLIPQKVAKLNERGESFYFLDGPPYATGGVHVGLAYNKILKDILLRYRRMQKFNVLDKPGFDIHGLPIELLVEKDLRINSGDIDKYGLDKFISSCRAFSKDSLARMSKEFSELGIWMDWENPYLTASPVFIESVWWSLKKAYENGSLVNAKRIVAWCPRCQTALSDHEIVHRERKMNVACIKVPLKNRQDEFILVWTTQPWTLPAAVAVAVSHDAIYQRIEIQGDEGREVLITLKSTADEIFNKAGVPKKTVLEEVTGTELSGEPIIHPLITEVQLQRNLSGTWVHKIIAHDYVRHSRTGAVYITPGLCPQDFDISLEYKLPVLIPLMRDGKFIPDFSSKYGGFEASEVSSLVIRDVKAGGLMFFEKDEKRNAKTCWRCGTPVIFRLDEEWFLRTVQIKPQMLNEIKTVNWHPTEFGTTRMRAWIEKVGDWCVSKRRYWGIPIPFWKCQTEGCDGSLFIGSVSDLHVAKGYRQGMSIHLPEIDALTFPCPKCKSPMIRVPQVADVWMDAAGASWAALGYPQNEDAFKKFWPAHIIIEGGDQVKGWFYSQLALSLLLFGRAPYVQAVAHGTIQAHGSKKMSKSLGNVIYATKMRDDYGSDALRLGLLLHGSIFENHIFNQNKLMEAKRTLSTLWNAYQFMNIWMKRSEFSPDIMTMDTIQAELAPEDKWILSRLEGLKLSMKEALDAFKYDAAALALVDFIREDLARIYIPAMKWRVRTEEDSHEKMIALRVMYDVFTGLSQAGAPLIPFTSEEMNSGIEGRLQSVFMMDYPVPNRNLIDPIIENMMRSAMNMSKVITETRKEAGIYLRWPLNKIVVKSANEETAKTMSLFSNFIAQKANVQMVEVMPLGQDWEQMILEVKPNPNAIGRVYRQWASKIGAMLKFQSARKIKEGIEKGEYMIGIEGQMIRILPDMVEFTSRLPDGVVERQFEGGTMYIDLNVTANTRKLGMAREVIRRIQQMRKEMNLAYGDFVETFLMSGPAVKTILSDTVSIIRDATHSRDVKFTDKPVGDYIVEWTLFDEVITIGLTPLHFDKVLKAFMSLPGINIKRARALFQAGFTTPESLHTATIEKMETIPDIGRSAARKIRRFIQDIEERGQRFSYVEDKKEDIGEKIEEVSVQIKTEMEEGTVRLEPAEGASSTEEDAGSRVAAAREESDAEIAQTKEGVAPHERFLEELAEVPGVGPSKAQMLCDAGYISIVKLASASVDELGSLPRIGRALARVIMTWAKEEEIKRGLMKKEVLMPKEEERLKTPQSTPPPAADVQPPQAMQQTQEDVHADIVSAVEDVIAKPPVVQTVSSYDPGKVYLFEKSNDYDALIAFTDTLQKTGSGLLMTSLPSQTILRFLPAHIIAEIASGYQAQGRTKTDFRLLYFSDRGDSETTIMPSNLERIVTSIEQYASVDRTGVILLDGIETIIKATSISTLAGLIAGMKIRLGTGCTLILGVGKSSFNERDVSSIEKECDVIIRR